MRVCYWGTYDKNYSRNKIIISGLKRNGVDVVECNAQIWQGTAEKVAAASSQWFSSSLIRKWMSNYMSLTRRFLSIKNVDFLMIGYSGHFDMFLAKGLSKLRRIPLIFDAYLSLYDSLVLDRKIVKIDSVKAKFLHWVDKHSCGLADIVLLDTNEHISYFSSEFGISRDRFRRVFIGADDRVFAPTLNSESHKSQFTVIHFGKYIPLHGMVYIIKAAKEMEGKNIHFKLIGSGDEYDSIVSLAAHIGASNVEFIPFLEQKHLVNYIARADVCLGIFGDTEKAKRVVPNKVYECMAMGRPVITGNSPATREILTDGENCLLCDMADSHALAKAIVRLKNDRVLQLKIARNGYKLYQKRCSPLALGGEVKNILQSSQNNQPEIVLE